MILDRSYTALVVDSTADLPDGVAHDPDLTIVPLTVYFGDEAYLDWTELRPEQFYEKLAAYPVREEYDRMYSVRFCPSQTGRSISVRVVS